MGVKSTKIAYFDGSYYEGAVNASGKQHGKGQINYANNDTLKGTFVDGDCTYAYLTKKNGDSYDGQMRDHKYHGTGKLITKNYQQNGLFRDNRFIHGKIVFSDGPSYEGSLQAGSKVGKGHYVAKDGTVYTGYFKNDKFEGSGQIIHKDGTTYKGTFKNGLYHGKGHLKQYANGSPKVEYDGTFKDGAFDGEGTLKLYESKDQYKGHFADGKKHGYGRYQYGTGDIYQGNYNNDVKQDQSCKIHMKGGSTYQGGIKNGAYHGKGHLTRSNGDYYDGAFVEGQKSGLGKLKVGDALYEGEFANDVKHGRGKITYQNEENQVFQGSFYNDLKHGKGVIQGRSQYFEATYKNGLKEGPYRKKIGSDYSQEGEYLADSLHGRVKIHKGEFVGIYRYQNGKKVQELHE